jgi:hypothetical protein
MNDSTPPVLKAWDRIFDLLKCIHDNPYNRRGFEESVLALFNSEYSKSVFRGMAIPTLRNLGFIVGFNDVIRISANGNLICQAYTNSRDDGLRVLRAILMEFDKKIGILSFLAEQSIYPIEDLIKELSRKIIIDDIRTFDNPEAQKRAAAERLRDWVKFLSFAELLYNDNKNVVLDKGHLHSAKDDLDENVEVKKHGFEINIIPAYQKIVYEQKGISTVEIEEVRKEVASRLYYQLRVILTENQFDILFAKFPKVTDTYILSLGRSMGADEKLFYYQNKYYQTMFFRFL